MSLSIKGEGSSITNKFPRGAAAEAPIQPFQISTFKDESGSNFINIINGEINYVDFYEKAGVQDGKLFEQQVTLDCEVALVAYFEHDKYEYKNITDIWVTSYSTSGDFLNDYKSKVDGDGDPYYVTLYIPLGYVYSAGDEADTVLVKQYFTGNIDFRTYYTITNGAIGFEFFKTVGRGPALIPPSTPP
jgi:hypothetical protein